MVVVVWLWIVPLLTCWMWRLGFTTSFLHGWNTVSQRMSPLLLLADCIQARAHVTFRRLHAQNGLLNNGLQPLNMVEFAGASLALEHLMA